jgi:hypothetical protein
MEKLLNAYIANPSSTELAKKVAAYAAKHPMSECLLSPQEHGWLRQAKTQAA